MSRSVSWRALQRKPQRRLQRAPAAASTKRVLCLYCRSTRRQRQRFRRAAARAAAARQRRWRRRRRDRAAAARRDRRHLAHLQRLAGGGWRGVMRCAVLRNMTRCELVSMWPTSSRSSSPHQRQSSRCSRRVRCVSVVVCARAETCARAAGDKAAGDADSDSDTSTSSNGDLARNIRSALHIVRSRDLIAAVFCVVRARLVGVAVRRRQWPHSNHCFK
jgi:hypothetical protein